MSHHQILHEASKSLEREAWKRAAIDEIFQEQGHSGLAVIQSKAEAVKDAFTMNVIEAYKEVIQGERHTALNKEHYLTPEEVDGSGAEDASWPVPGMARPSKVAHHAADPSPQGGVDTDNGVLTQPVNAGTHRRGGRSRRQPPAGRAPPSCWRKWSNSVWTR